MARSTLYVTGAEIGAQLGFSPVQLGTDPGNADRVAHLDELAVAASDAIDNDLGRTDPLDVLDPVPPTVRIVALALGVDMAKMVDAAGGVMGSDETGVVRPVGDALGKYRQLLHRYRMADAWGIA